MQRVRGGSKSASLGRPLEVQRRIIKSSSVAQLSSLVGNPRGKPCPLPHVSCPENKRARNLTESAQFLSSSEGLAGGLRRFLILPLDIIVFGGTDWWFETVFDFAPRHGVDDPPSRPHLSGNNQVSGLPTQKGCACNPSDLVVEGPQRPRSVLEGLSLVAKFKVFPECVARVPVSLGVWG